MSAASCGTPTPATTRVVQIEPGPMPTLTASAPASTSALGAGGGGDVAGDDLDLVRQPADARRPRRSRRGEWPCAVSTTMTSTPASTSASARSSPASPVPVAAPDAQPALLVLAGVREALRLLDVLDGDQADQPVVVVDDQQLLDPVLMQQPPGLLARHALAHGDQPLVGHQLAHRRLASVREADVAVGQDADQPAVAASTTGRPEMRCRAIRSSAVAERRRRARR